MITDATATCSTQIGAEQANTHDSPASRRGSPSPVRCSVGSYTDPQVLVSTRMSATGSAASLLTTTLVVTSSPGTTAWR